MNPKTKVYKIPCSICGKVIEKRVSCSKECMKILLRNSRTGKTGEKNETLVDMTGNWWEKKPEDNFNIPKIEVIQKEENLGVVKPEEQVKMEQPQPRPIIMCEHGSPIGHCEFGCL